MGRGNSIDYSGVALMVEQGLTTRQIVTSLGCCFASVSKYMRKHGLKARHPATAPKSRDDKILSMHRQGVNMTKIASQMDITRERVRQILKKHGITGREAEAAKKVKKTESKQAAREARCLAKHGMTLAAYAAAVKAGHAASYRSQKNAANARGIEWALSFAEWLAIWEQSGKLDLRGRGVGYYVMSRVCDSGGYVFGNVHIQLSTENNREFITKNRGKRNVNPGVYLMYPGLDRSWSAYACRKFLGNFATEQEAIAARDTFLAARPKKPRRASNRLGAGRGYYLTGGSFQVMVAGQYVGRFKTEPEAITARQAALAQLAA